MGRGPTALLPPVPRLSLESPCVTWLARAWALDRLCHSAWVLLQGTRWRKGHECALALTTRNTRTISLTLQSTSVLAPSVSLSLLRLPSLPPFLFSSHCQLLRSTCPCPCIARQQALWCVCVREREKEKEQLPHDALRSCLSRSWLDNILQDEEMQR